jgi:hypothetical protein
LNWSPWLPFTAHWVLQYWEQMYSVTYPGQPTVYTIMHDNIVQPLLQKSWPSNTRTFFS